ncbi:hypothetical protein [Pseudobdellovibrio exovorus]|uniref:Uncharacterized protein n=1 Tax=Pseudobdellovibrio exovorus JSS TaxID=1184267 RepID=M4VAU5_9BACT|nr:hypothetical protein [Pseudobdellovibrio exovorus]AGH96492.1 hypothetical protein A11Q_2276 [Pseudobdellovibrio exovorus JSS]
MIKLASFFVFLGVFVWTWFLFNSAPKINLQTHAGIQSKFVTLIEESVKKSRPLSKDFEVLNIYTQKIDDNQISAHFSYQYLDVLENEETSKQVIKGEAVLHRSPSENPENELWVIKSVRTGSPNIEFQEGLIVNPEAAPTAPAGTEATTEAPTGTQPVAPSTEETQTH